MKYIAFILVLVSLLATGAQAGEKETSEKSTKDGGGNSIG
jgi:hypothetical protein